MGKALDLPVLDPGEAFKEQERRDGLVLKMSGRLDERQELVKYEAGKPRSLLVVETEPKRPSRSPTRSMPTWTNTTCPRP